MSLAGSVYVSLSAEQELGKRVLFSGVVEGCDACLAQASRICIQFKT